MGVSPTRHNKCEIFLGRCITPGDIVRLILVPDSEPDKGHILELERLVNWGREGPLDYLLIFPISELCLELKIFAIRSTF